MINNEEKSNRAMVLKSAGTEEWKAASQIIRFPIITLFMKISSVISTSQSP